MILIILSFIFNLIPPIIFFIFYSALPDLIPASVDLLGNPISYMQKSYFSVIRLPLMGMLLSSLCLIMYLEKLPTEAKKVNKLIWPVAALICSFKTGISSLEILFAPEQTVIYYRISVFVLVVIGIAVLIYGLTKLLKSKQPFFDKNEMGRKKLYLIAGIVFAYAIVVLMPRFLMLNPH
jgi:hypothetical protein